MRRSTSVLAILLAAGALHGCSVNGFVAGKVGDALAGSGSSWSTEDDPELVREALPFALKTMESLAAEAPTPRRPAPGALPRLLELRRRLPRAGCGEDRGRGLRAGDKAPPPGRAPLPARAPLLPRGARPRVRGRRPGARQAPPNRRLPASARAASRRSTGPGSPGARRSRWRSIGPSGWRSCRRCGSSSSAPWFSTRRGTADPCMRR